MVLDMKDLKNSFKAIYKIDIINSKEELIKHSIELFVQYKIKTDPDYVCPSLSSDNFSFIKEFNSYLKKLQHDVSFDENMNVLYIHKPFLEKYKEELFLSLNPIHFKEIKYTRKHFYFLYYREVIDTLDMVLNKEIKRTFDKNKDTEFLLKKYDYLFKDKDLLSSFISYKIELNDIDYRNILYNLFNPFKSIVSTRYLKGTKEVSQMKKERDNISAFFKDTELNFPEMIKFYSSGLEEFNHETKTRALFFLDYVLKELIKNKKVY